MAHPGLTATDLIKKMGGASPSCWLGLAECCIMRTIAQSVEQGSKPLILCACSSKAQAGDFWGPKDIIKGPPIMCGRPEIIQQQRGPYAWELFHGNEATKMCIELSDRVINPFLKKTEVSLRKED